MSRIENSHCTISISQLVNQLGLTTEDFYDTALNEVSDV